MRWSSLLFVLASAALALAKMPVAQYRPLPTLYEQNELEEGWVQKRYEFIPSVLKKQ